MVHVELADAAIVHVDDVEHVAIGGRQAQRQVVAVAAVVDPDARSDRDHHGVDDVVELGRRWLLAAVAVGGDPIVDDVVAVVIDAVADLFGTRVDGGVGVVAVIGQREAIAVVVDGGVDATAAAQVAAVASVAAVATVACRLGAFTTCRKAHR